MLFEGVGQAGAALPCSGLSGLHLLAQGFGGDAVALEAGGFEGVGGLGALGGGVGALQLDFQTAYLDVHGGNYGDEACDEGKQGGGGEEFGFQGGHFRRPRLFQQYGEQLGQPPNESDGLCVCGIEGGVVLVGIGKFGVVGVFAVVGAVVAAGEVWPIFVFQGGV